MKKEGNGAEFFDYLSRSQQSENENFLSGKEHQQRQQEAAENGGGEDVFHDSNPNDSNLIHEPQTRATILGRNSDKGEAWKADLQQQHRQEKLTQAISDNNTPHNRSDYRRLSTAADVAPRTAPPMIYDNQRYSQNEGNSSHQNQSEPISSSSMNNLNKQDHNDFKQSRLAADDQEHGNVRRKERDQAEQGTPLSRDFVPHKAKSSSPSNYYNESSNEIEYSSSKYPARHHLRQGYDYENTHVRAYSPLLHRQPPLPLMHHFAAPVVDPLAGISPQEINAILEENHFLRHELDRLYQQFHLEKFDLQERLRYFIARVKYLEGSKKKGITVADNLEEEDLDSYHRSSQQRGNNKDDDARVTTEQKQPYHEQRDGSTGKYLHRDKGKNKDPSNNVKGSNINNDNFDDKVSNLDYNHRHRPEGKKARYQPFKDEDMAPQNPLPSSPTFSSNHGGRVKNIGNDRRNSNWHGRPRYLRTPLYESTGYFEYPYDGVETEEEDAVDVGNDLPGGDLYHDLEGPLPLPGQFALSARFRKGVPPPPSLPLSHLPSPIFMMPSRMHPPPPPLPAVVSPLAFKPSRRHYQQQENVPPPPPPFPPLAQPHLAPSWPMQQEDFIEESPYFPNITPTPSRRSSFRRHRRHSRKLDVKELHPKYSFSDFDHQRQQQPQLEADLFSDQELLNEEDEEHINFLLHRMSVSGPPPPPPPSDMLNPRGVPPPPPPPAAMMNMYNDMLPPPHHVPVISPNPGGLLRRVSSRRSAPGGIGN